MCVGPLFPGEGGVVTLVQACLLNGSQVRVHAHSPNVRMELARAAVLIAVTLHLPPALLVARRQVVVGDASAFLPTAGASVQVVAGDLNKPLVGVGRSPRP